MCSTTSYFFSLAIVLNSSVLYAILVVFVDLFLLYKHDSYPFKIFYIYFINFFNLSMHQHFWDFLQISIYDLRMSSPLRVKDHM